jgi:hypothetical protein
MWPAPWKEVHLWSILTWTANTGKPWGESTSGSGKWTFSSLSADCQGNFRWMLLVWEMLASRMELWRTNGKTCTTLLPNTFKFLWHVQYNLTDAVTESPSSILLRAKGCSNGRHLWTKVIHLRDAWTPWNCMTNGHELTRNLFHEVGIGLTILSARYPSSVGINSQLQVG